MGRTRPAKRQTIDPMLNTVLGKFVYVTMIFVAAFCGVTADPDEQPPSSPATLPTISVDDVHTLIAQATDPLKRQITELRATIEGHEKRLTEVHTAIAEAVIAATELRTELQSALKDEVCSRIEFKELTVLMKEEFTAQQAQVNKIKNSTASEALNLRATMQSIQTLVSDNVSKVAKDMDVQFSMVSQKFDSHNSSFQAHKLQAAEENNAHFSLLRKELEAHNKSFQSHREQVEKNFVQHDQGRVLLWNALEEHKTKTSKSSLATNLVVDSLNTSLKQFSETQIRHLASFKNSTELLLQQQLDSHATQANRSLESLRLNVGGELAVHKDNISSVLRQITATNATAEQIRMELKTHIGNTNSTHKSHQKSLETLKNETMLEIEVVRRIVLDHAVEMNLTLVDQKVAHDVHALNATSMIAALRADLADLRKVSAAESLSMQAEHNKTNEMYLAAFAAQRADYTEAHDHLNNSLATHKVQLADEIGACRALAMNLSNNHSQALEENRLELDAKANITEQAHKFQLEVIKNTTFLEIEVVRQIILDHTINANQTWEVQNARHVALENKSMSVHSALRSEFVEFQSASFNESMSHKAERAADLESHQAALAAHKAEYTQIHDLLNQTLNAHKDQLDDDIGSCNAHARNLSDVHTSALEEYKTETRAALGAHAVSLENHKGSANKTDEVFKAMLSKTTELFEAFRAQVNQTNVENSRFQNETLLEAQVTRQIILDQAIEANTTWHEQKMALDNLATSMNESSEASRKILMELINETVKTAELDRKAFETHRVEWESVSKEFQAELTAHRNETLKALEMHADNVTTTFAHHQKAATESTSTIKSALEAHINASALALEQHKAEANATWQQQRAAHDALSVAADTLRANITALENQTSAAMEASRKDLNEYKNASFEALETQRLNFISELSEHKKTANETAAAQTAALGTHKAEAMQLFENHGAEANQTKIEHANALALLKNDTAREIQVTTQIILDQAVEFNATWSGQRLAQEAFASEMNRSAETLWAGIAALRNDTLTVAEEDRRIVNLHQNRTVEALESVKSNFSAQLAEHQKSAEEAVIVLKAALDANAEAATTALEKQKSEANLTRNMFLDHAVKANDTWQSQQVAHDSLADATNLSIETLRASLSTLRNETFARADDDRKSFDEHRVEWANGHKSMLDLVEKHKNESEQAVSAHITNLTTALIEHKVAANETATAHKAAQDELSAFTIDALEKHKSEANATSDAHRRDLHGLRNETAAESTAIKFLIEEKANLTQSAHDKAIGQLKDETWLEMEVIKQIILDHAVETNATWKNQWLALDALRNETWISAESARNAFDEHKSIWASNASALQVALVEYKNEFAKALEERASILEAFLTEHQKYTNATTSKYEAAFDAYVVSATKNFEEQKAEANQTRVIHERELVALRNYTSQEIEVTRQIILDHAADANHTWQSLKSQHHASSSSTNQSVEALRGITNDIIKAHAKHEVDIAKVLETKFQNLSVSVVDNQRAGHEMALAHKASLDAHVNSTSKRLEQLAAQADGTRNNHTITVAVLRAEANELWNKHKTAHDALASVVDANHNKFIDHKTVWEKYSKSNQTS